MSEQLTLFAEDSPVRISQQPDWARVWTEPGRASGLNTPAWLASFDPASCSWKTSQLSLEGGLSEFSGTWPRSGMMRSGIAYQLLPLAPLTAATASGSLPTPRKNSAMSATITPESAWSEKRFPNLETVVGRMFFPTPTATDHKSESMSLGLVQKRQAASNRGVRLTEFLHRQTVPTPMKGNKGEVDADSGRMGWLVQSLPRHRDWPLTAEPVLDRGTDGIPHRVDRCGALGNAVVPQIPELIGNAILASL